MTAPLDLDAIRTRSDQYRDTPRTGPAETVQLQLAITAARSADDVPALLAEVDRMRKIVDEAVELVAFARSQPDWPGFAHTLGPLIALVNVYVHGDEEEEDSRG